MKTGEDKLKMSLYLLDKADDLLLTLGNKDIIDELIRKYIIKAMDNIEKLLES